MTTDATSVRSLIIAPMGSRIRKPRRTRRARQIREDERQAFYVARRENARSQRHPPTEYEPPDAPDPKMIEGEVNHLTWTGHRDVDAAWLTRNYHALDEARWLQAKPAFLVDPDTDRPLDLFRPGLYLAIPIWPSGEDKKGGCIRSRHVRTIASEPYDDLFPIDRCPRGMIYQYRNWTRMYGRAPSLPQWTRMKSTSTGLPETPVQYARDIQSSTAQADPGKEPWAHESEFPFLYEYTTRARTLYYTSRQITDGFIACLEQGGTRFCVRPDE